MKKKNALSQTLLLLSIILCRESSKQGDHPPYIGTSYYMLGDSPCMRSIQLCQAILGRLEAVLALQVYLRTGPRLRHTPYRTYIDTQQPYCPET